MSEAEAAKDSQPDPMEKFKELRDAYLAIWSKNLIDAVNTEGYAKASGATLDSFLNASTPYKEAAEQAMLRTLQQLNIPTSVDFTTLAGRFTNIEMQLDNMDAKLDRIEKLTTGQAAAKRGPAAGGGAAKKQQVPVVRKAAKRTASAKSPRRNPGKGAK